MHVREIAVIRALNLGDLLCATPALRSLRQRFPEARVTFVGLPWSAEFVRHCDSIDAFIEFPGWCGIPEREFDGDRFRAFTDALPADGFDLAIQMHGSGREMNDFVATIPAHLHAAFAPSSGHRPARWRGRTVLVPYPEHLPEPRRLLRLTECLGARSAGEDLEFVLSERDRDAARQLRAVTGLREQGYVCLHPGAASGGRWPVEHFAGLARELLAEGLQVAVTGVASEGALAAAIIEEAGAEVVDLTGRTALGTLAALIADAQLLVANDTGVSHLAAALRVPSVVVFTTSEFERWAPLDRERHIALRAGHPDTPSRADVIDAALGQLRRAA